MDREHTPLEKIISESLGKVDGQRHAEQVIRDPKAKYNIPKTFVMASTGQTRVDPISWGNGFLENINY